ncbi:MAG: UDP-N-acetylglucosamine 2-epimerase (hydrolyzing) [Candidatus Omnitrophica bacterium]|nr:UDP-N-acetylglucosamine 2-epimerase (hydrolyzing) [Candidatus Omnitrophota bacterium]
MAGGYKRIRKVAVFTGSRSEYGILKPIMRAIKPDKSFSLQTIVSGMHLSAEFGNTLNAILKDGFEVSAKINPINKKDNSLAMAEYLGDVVKSAVKALSRLSPDIVLILGDRVDALGVTIAAAYMNIPIAHIHGGDITGSGLDEPARHSISKFAQIHFAATKKSAERLIKMGEERKRIFIIGAPGLETIVNQETTNKEKLAKKFKIDLNDPIILLIQHPVTTNTKEAANQIKETLEAVKKFECQTIIVYPNADSGGRSMIKVIDRYKSYKFIRAFKSIEHNDYLGLMSIASCMVGNSSSGIIEAASFNLPVVNIGERQKGRERGNNVIDVGYDRNDISKAIKKALFDNRFIERVNRSKNLYGDGKSSRKIIGVLRQIKIDQQFLQKRITY